MVSCGTNVQVRRDAREASFAVRWIARRLLAREARALAALDGLDGVPDLVSADRDTLQRCHIEGQPMQEGKPTDPTYFRAAARLLRRLHRMGVVHNDLAKEPNFLLTKDGQPALIDFQLAWVVSKRGRLFRILAREDKRHLLKHKRTYCPNHLTRREKHILSNPSRCWPKSGCVAGNRSICLSPGA